MSFARVMQATFPVLWVLTKPKAPSPSVIAPSIVSNPKTESLPMALMLIDFGQMLRITLNSKFGWSINVYNSSKYIDAGGIVTDSLPSNVLMYMPILFLAVTIALLSLVGLIAHGETKRTSSSGRETIISCLKALTLLLVFGIFKSVVGMLLQPLDPRFSDNRFSSVALNALIASLGCLIAVLFIGYAVLLSLFRFSVDALSPAVLARHTGRGDFAYSIWRSIVVVATTLANDNQSLAIAVHILSFIILFRVIQIHLNYMPMMNNRMMIVRIGMLGALLGAEIGGFMRTVGLGGDWGDSGDGWMVALWVTCALAGSCLNVYLSLRTNKKVLWQSKVLHNAVLLSDQMISEFSKGKDLISTMPKSERLSKTAQACLQEYSTGMHQRKQHTTLHMSGLDDTSRDARPRYNLQMATAHFQNGTQAQHPMSGNGQELLSANLSRDSIAHDIQAQVVLLAIALIETKARQAYRQEGEKVPRSHMTKEQIKGAFKHMPTNSTAMRRLLFCALAAYGSDCLKSYFDIEPVQEAFFESELGSDIDESSGSRDPHTATQQNPDSGPESDKLSKVSSQPSSYGLQSQRMKQAAFTTMTMSELVEYSRATLPECPWMAIANMQLAAIKAEGIPQAASYDVVSGMSMPIDARYLIYALQRSEEAQEKSGDNGSLGNLDFRNHLQDAVSAMLASLNALERLWKLSMHPRKNAIGVISNFKLFFSSVEKAKHMFASLEARFPTNADSFLTHALFLEHVLNDPSTADMKREQAKRLTEDMAEQIAKKESGSMAASSQSSASSVANDRVSSLQAFTKDEQSIKRLQDFVFIAVLALLLVATAGLILVITLVFNQSLENTMLRSSQQGFIAVESVKALYFLRKYQVSQFLGLNSLAQATTEKLIERAESVSDSKTDLFSKASYQGRQILQTTMTNWTSLTQSLQDNEWKSTQKDLRDCTMSWVAGIKEAATADGALLSDPSRLINSTDPRIRSFYGVALNTMPFVESLESAKQQFTDLVFERGQFGVIVVLINAVFNGFMIALIGVLIATKCKRMFVTVDATRGGTLALLLSSRMTKERMARQYRMSLVVVQKSLSAAMNNDVADMQDVNDVPDGLEAHHAEANETNQVYKDEDEEEAILEMKSNTPTPSKLVRRLSRTNSGLTTAKLQVHSMTANSRNLSPKQSKSDRIQQWAAGANLKVVPEANCDAENSNSEEHSDANSNVSSLSARSNENSDPGKEIIEQDIGGDQSEAKESSSDGDGSGETQLMSKENSPLARLKQDEPDLSKGVSFAAEVQVIRENDNTSDAVESVPSDTQEGAAQGKFTEKSTLAYSRGVKSALKNVDSADDTDANISGPFGDTMPQTKESSKKQTRPVRKGSIVPVDHDQKEDDSESESGESEYGNNSLANQCLLKIGCGTANDETLDLLDRKHKQIFCKLYDSAQKPTIRRMSMVYWSLTILLGSAAASILTPLSNMVFLTNVAPVLRETNAIALAASEVSVLAQEAILQETSLLMPHDKVVKDLKAKADELNAKVTGLRMGTLKQMKFGAGEMTTWTAYRTLMLGEGKYPAETCLVSKPYSCAPKGAHSSRPSAVVSGLDVALRSLAKSATTIASKYKPDFPADMTLAQKAQILNEDDDMTFMHLPGVGPGDAHSGAEILQQTLTDYISNEIGRLTSLTIGLFTMYAVILVLGFYGIYIKTMTGKLTDEVGKVRDFAVTIQMHKIDMYEALMIRTALQIPESAA